MAPVAVETHPTPLPAVPVAKGLPSAPAPTATAANVADADEDTSPDISKLTPEQLAELDRLAKISESKLPVDWNPDYKYKWALPWFDERYKADFFKDPPLGPFEQCVAGRCERGSAADHALPAARTSACAP